MKLPFIGHKDEAPHKKGVSGIASFFRMIISLFVFSLLAIATYAAFRSFSGVDPLTLNPKTFIAELISSESLFEVANNILSVDPQQTINKAKKALGQQVDELNPNTEEVVSGRMLFKFALVADSHNDNQNLEKALIEAKNQGAKFVIGLGDYSDVGTVEELQSAKKQFDTVKLTYYSTSGDHDLWDARDKKLEPSKNYMTVFGAPYNSFAYENIRFLIIYNSDNYEGISDIQKSWIEENLSQAAENDEKILVFSHMPFYHPSSDHVMGKTQASLRAQATEMINMFSKYGIEGTFAGDTHIYSSYKEPNTGLKMTTIGALTSSRNLQNPRFAIVDVFEQGQYTIKDIELK